MADKPTIIDQDTDDSFLSKRDVKYEGGKTLEEMVEELGIKTKPLKLPPRTPDD